MRRVEKACYARRAKHDAQSVDLQVAGNNRVTQSLYCSLRFEPVYGCHRRTQEGAFAKLARVVGVAESSWSRTNPGAADAPHRV